MRKGRPKVALILTAEERQRLESFLRIGRDRPRRWRGGRGLSWRAPRARLVS